MSQSTDAVAKVPTDLSIGGSWVGASDGSRFDVADPATGEVIASVASASADDATAAIDAADGAAAEWAATPPARALRDPPDAPSRRMRDRADEIAEVIVRESGKSWGDAAGELQLLARSSSAGTPRRRSASAGP